MYRDPVRDSRKITDFDVHSWKPGIRERYERSTAAAAIAETILAGYGGGGAWEDAFRLADASLGALETADEPCCARIFVHFLWQWAEVLGIRPDLDEPSDGGANACEAAGNGVSWEPGLGPGARRWLAAVRDLAPAQMTRYTLDGAAFRQARAFVTGILGEALGKRLGTWDF
jgi:DNA repair protein RecO (recombination protein O)